MLIWLKDSDFPVSPSRATHDCVIFQYWAYTMVVHTPCVNNLSIPYVNTEYYTLLIDQLVRTALQILGHTIVTY
jgi:hypothetical protein